MKRLVYAMIVLAAALSVSCQKDEIGNTATVEMAGEWYVRADILDTDGTLIYEDCMGGSFVIATFNTAADVETEMFVSDCGNFWQFQVPVKADPTAMTFATDGAESNLTYEDCDVTITDGKILKGGAVTPSGVATDGIDFKVAFSDDPDGFVYRIYGFRYTGLDADM
ncbi:MAG: lipid-binding protein [Candidatus Cryptobacteroides sp.]